MWVIAGCYRGSSIYYQKQFLMNSNYVSLGDLEHAKQFCTRFGAKFYWFRHQDPAIPEVKYMTLEQAEHLVNLHKNMLITHRRGRRSGIKHF